MIWGCKYAGQKTRARKQHYLLALVALVVLAQVGSRGTHISGQPRHSHQWAAEALTSVGSRGTHISRSGQNLEVRQPVHTWWAALLASTRTMLFIYDIFSKQISVHDFRK